MLKLTRYSFLPTLLECHTQCPSLLLQAACAEYADSKCLQQLHRLCLAYTAMCMCPRPFKGQEPHIAHVQLQSVCLVMPTVSCIAMASSTLDICAKHGVACVQKGTALMYASVKSNSAIIDALLSAGADVNTNNDEVQC